MIKNKLSIILLSAILCTISNNGYSMQINNSISNEVYALINSEITNQFAFLQKLENAISRLNGSASISVPYIGLQNLSATCFINSAVQLLANCHDWVLKLFKEVKRKYNSLFSTQEGIITLEFTNVLAELVLGNKQYYSPNSFRNLLAKFKPSDFELNKAGESKDVVLYIVESLHTALNNATSQINTACNQYNRNEVFNAFGKDFMNNNRSLISDDMYAMTTSIITCPNCKTEAYSTQMYNILFFELEQVRQMKYNNKKQSLQSYNTSPINIYDCFDYYKKEIIISDYVCNNCGPNLSGTQTNEFEYTPNILIIHLNRGPDKVNNVKIKIPESANFNKWVNHKELQDGNYYLAAVSCHIGKSDQSGHWVTYARRSDKDPWVEYNDATVTRIQDNNIIKDILDGNSNQDPCIVVYKKVEKKQIPQIQINNNTSNNNMNQYSLNQNNYMSYNNMPQYGNGNPYGFNNYNGMSYNTVQPNNMQQNYVYSNMQQYNNMISNADTMPNNSMLLSNNMGMNMNYNNNGYNNMNSNMIYNNSYNNNEYNNNFNSINSNTMDNTVNKFNNINNNQ